MAAIANRKCIVSHLWILNNYISSTIINTVIFLNFKLKYKINKIKFNLKKYFEIQSDYIFKDRNGGHIARFSNRKLFNDVEIVFVEPFNETEISLTSLKELTALCGASIKQTLDNMSPKDNSKVLRKILIYDEKCNSFTAFNAAILKTCAEIDCIEKSWLFGCIVSYTILKTNVFCNYK